MGSALKTARRMVSVEVGMKEDERLTISSDVPHGKGADEGTVD